MLFVVCCLLRVVVFVSFVMSVVFVGCMSVVVCCFFHASCISDLCSMYVPCVFVLLFDVLSMLCDVCCCLFVVCCFFFFVFGCLLIINCGCC